MKCNRCFNRMTTVKYEQNNGYCEECIRRIGLQMAERDPEEVYMLDEIWRAETIAQAETLLSEPTTRGNRTREPWWNLPCWLQQIALNLGVTQEDYLDAENYE